jgi:RNA polymerase sigma-70 factor (ECF subfamily)
MVLREIEGLSTAEVAESLDISEDVVKTRLHRARALLSSRVEAGDPQLEGAFPFHARRCDRVVAAVMSRLSLLGTRS